MPHKFMSYVYNFVGNMSAIYHDCDQTLGACYSFLISMMFFSPNDFVKVSNGRMIEARPSLGVTQ